MAKYYLSKRVVNGLSEVQIFYYPKNAPRGTRIRLHTGIMVETSRFDFKGEKVKIKVSKTETKEIQKGCSEQEKKLNDLNNHLEKIVKDNGALGKEELQLAIDKFLHPEKFVPKEEKPIVQTLMQAVEKFIADAPTRIQPKKGRPIGARTIMQHKNTQSKLTEYLKKKRIKDINISDVNQDFYNSFVNFLYEQGFKMNTVGKHIKNIKAAINALPQEQRVMCEFVEQKKCAKLAEDVDTIYLTEDELNTIATIQLPAEYLDKVRDQFILLAWTGCRYSDLDKLNRDNIHKMSNGHECFKIEQQKTETKVIIPILPQAREILEKYDYNIPKVIANQKFNEFLKEVARLAGLDDEVTITHTQINEDSKKAERVTQRFAKWECVTAHTARRSFATNMYKRDFPTLMIMAITGHKSESSFLKYIKVTEEENAERMMEKFMQQSKLY